MLVEVICICPCFHIHTCTYMCCSDCANVELEALSVLLKSNMWEKVITVLKGIQPEVSSIYS